MNIIVRFITIGAYKTKHRINSTQCVLFNNLYVSKLLLIKKLLTRNHTQIQHMTPNMIVNHHINPTKEPNPVK